MPDDVSPPASADPSPPASADPSPPASADPSPPASGDPSPLLVTRDVSVHYGGVRANDQVCIEVGPAEIVGLIGPNGAGKTTFVDAVTGFAPYTGTVELDADFPQPAHSHRGHGRPRRARPA